MVLLAVFEEVDRAGEVVLDDLARTGATVNAGQHAGIGGGIDDEIARRQRLEIAGCTHVGMKKLHADFFQFEAVGFAAGTDEIVQAKNLMAGSRQRAGEGAADKTAGAGEEDSHRSSLIQLSPGGKA